MDGDSNNTNTRLKSIIIVSRRTGYFFIFFFIFFFAKSKIIYSLPNLQNDELQTVKRGTLASFLDSQAIQFDEGQFPWEIKTS